MNLPSVVVVFQIVNGDNGERTEPMCMAFDELPVKLLELTPAERFSKDYVLILGETRSDDAGDFNFLTFPMMVIQTFVERYLEKAA